MTDKNVLLPPSQDTTSATNNNKNPGHRRNSSIEECLSPYEEPENYYGPKTDPSKLKKDSKYGRTRTLSATHLNPRRPPAHFFPFTLFQGHEEFVKSGSTTPTFLDERKRALGGVGSLNGSTTAVFDIDGDEKDKENGSDDDSSASDTSAGLAHNESTSSLVHALDQRLANETIRVMSRSPSPTATPTEVPTPSASTARNTLKLQFPPKLQSQTSSSSVTGSTVLSPPRSSTPVSTNSSGLRRRASLDDSTTKRSKRFFISDIDATLEELLRNEDTDGNCQITIDDKGPKVLKLGTANSNGFKQYDIRGTYMLSNLLQELTIAKRMGRQQVILDEARLNENPVDRLKRLISGTFWKNLTRQMNEKSVLDMAVDTKIDTPEAKLPRIYVPWDDELQFNRIHQINQPQTWLIGLSSET
ncbi:unnamed protein product [Ambrosiozyma monospora]|uniref:Unnamed protein product n=1 Tax=Ambrosiozyma monospora TaxID=43982 RepID=A0ACB5SUC1_AMBMO|nr:unnamed protein product [Ambrosiozyma monospora]